MSQFCGSFAALSKRSLLTVILYCAEVCDAASTVIDTPAIAAQAIVTSFRLQYCMTVPPLKPPVRCGRHVAVATALTRNNYSIREAPTGQRPRRGGTFHRLHQQPTNRVSAYARSRTFRLSPFANSTIDRRCVGRAP